MTVIATEVPRAASTRCTGGPQASTTTSGTCCRPSSTSQFDGTGDWGGGPCASMKCWPFSALVLAACPRLRPCHARRQADRRVRVSEAVAPDARAGVWRFEAARTDNEPAAATEATQAAHPDGTPDLSAWISDRTARSGAVTRAARPLAEPRASLPTCHAAGSAPPAREPAPARNSS